MPSGVEFFPYICVFGAERVNGRNNRDPDSGFENNEGINTGAVGRAFI